MNNLDQFIVKLSKKGERINIDVLDECGFPIYFCQANPNPIHTKYIIRAEFYDETLTEILLYHQLVRVKNSHQFKILILTNRALLSII